jgi:non-ribosomal peptide synthetase component F
VAELSEAINLNEIAVGLPRRIHDVTARQAANAPDRIALVEDGASWSYAIWISVSARSPPSCRRWESERATG